MSKCDTMTEFAKQINDLIAESGLTMSAAAKVIGMDHGNLSRILNGKEGLTLERAERIANRLGATLSVKVKKKAKISAA